MSNIKKFDKFFVANLRRTAQMVSPAVREKQKLQKMVAEATEKIQMLDAQIDALDSHIKAQTGGYGVEELVIRNVVDTGKTDKDGHPIKVTKWELRYPETIIPTVDVPENADNDIDDHLFHEKTEMEEELSKIEEEQQLESEETDEII